MIYIQSDSDRTRAHHFDAASAQFGAIETEQNYRLTSFEEIAKFTQLIKTNLFVGSVEFMKEVFSKIGLTDVRLPRNSNRQFEIKTLGQVRDLVKSGEKWFIKPIDIKLFTGFVLDTISLSSISGIPDDTQVLVYPPFESRIVSEWRTYIHYNKIVDCKNYSGDLFTIPNQKYILDVISSNKDEFPIAYTIDIGILENGENVVIEYNDMWSIGNYGLPNDLYLRLLKDRYFEIIRNGK